MQVEQHCWQLKFTVQCARTRRPVHALYVYSEQRYNTVLNRWVPNQCCIRSKSGTDAVGSGVLQWRRLEVLSRTATRGTVVVDISKVWRPEDLKLRCESSMYWLSPMYTETCYSYNYLLRQERQRPGLLSALLNVPLIDGTIHVEIVDQPFSFYTNTRI